jgi:hypothetical protein
MRAYEFITEVNIDPIKGIGNVPNNQEVEYLGVKVNMKPSIFLKLASKFDSLSGNEEKVKKMAEYIKNGGLVAPPFLNINFQNIKPTRKNPDPYPPYDFTKPAMVSGHEGRHRMKAILLAEGDEPVEVHLFFFQVKRRGLNKDLLTSVNTKLISQDGPILKGPFFTMISTLSESVLLENIHYNPGKWWINPKTKETIHITNPNPTYGHHCPDVYLYPEKYGLTKQQVKDVCPQLAEKDYDPGIMKLMNDNNWVRVVIQKYNINSREESYTVYMETDDLRKAQLTLKLLLQSLYIKMVVLDITKDDGTKTSEQFTDDDIDYFAKRGFMPKIIHEGIFYRSPLYHATTSKNILAIIDANKLTAITTHNLSLPNKPLRWENNKRGVSLTRDYAFAKFWGKKFNKYKGDFTDGFCILVLDQEKLIQNHKLIPVNYFKNHTNIEKDGFEITDEAEEFVIGSIENLDRYIIRIDVPKSVIIQFEKILSLPQGNEWEENQYNRDKIKLFLQNPKINVIKG